jgi:phosphoenolpyruvate-protein phosphotransferase
MLKGMGISDGIGIGKAVILNDEDIKTEKIRIDDIEQEKKIFFAAIQSVKNETEELIKNLNGTEKDIMEAYLMILQDDILVQETVRIIENEKCNAAYGADSGFNKIIQMFEQMDDPYMAARSRDIADMKRKVLSKILNIKEINLSNLPVNTILVAKELSTSNTAKLDLKNIEGIITEIGGENSHTAIMARTHRIPAIVGIKNVTNLINEEDTIAINGKTGEIFENPSETEEANLRKIKEKSDNMKKELEEYKNLPSITKDGHKVELMANIGDVNDINIVIENTSEGVGLFRSEFLYMNSDDFPTENEQFEAYKKVAESMPNKKIVIRTLDIGGDKNLKYMKLPQEENPFLGYRAIRIYLDNIALFKVQLRAILRASHFGNLAIMFPMIASVKELVDAKKVVEDVKNELKEKNIQFNNDIEIGIMIEIPSAAIMADELAKECDFFSIGTNDLIQYTLAVERGNEKVASLYTHFHPAVIRLIKYVIDSAHNNGIICGMCGEAAGDSLYIPLLVGMGLDDFSMNANKILESRKLVRNLNYTKCKVLADEILSMVHREDIKERLKNFQKELI